MPIQFKTPNSCSHHQSTQRKKMSLYLIICFLVLVILLVCLLLNQTGQRLVALGRIWGLSARCDSFYAWAEMLQQQTFISFTDHSSPGVDIPQGPHIILCNHINSHFTLGSFLTIAGAVTAPSHIVCYQSYNNMVLVSSTVHHLLRNEITIDRRLGNADKEFRMISGIRNSLAHGRNVVMFIDNPESDTTPMRALNHKVLGFFPDIPKQLVQIMEPGCDANVFHFRRFPATLNVDDIVVRRELIRTTAHLK
jgi:hypothetical protein